MSTVTVVASDASVAIRPWVVSLEPGLTIHRKLSVNQPDAVASGLRISRQITYRDEPLFSVAEGAGYVYPGLLERVLLHLEDSGVDYQLVDVRTPVPPLDMSKVNVELRDGQPEIMQVMGTSRNGTIKAATGLGKTETIVQFVRACGRLKVAIVTFKGDVRDSIFDRVRAGCPEKTVCMIRAGSTVFGADVYVLASQSLHRLPEEDIDVVIIDEVHGAGASESFTHLCALAGKRVYGFSATPEGRHDDSDLAVECLCGPIRASLSYGFSVASGANVPVYCYFYDAPGPTDLKSQPDFVRERRGIWANHARNRLIAHLSSQLDEDEQTLIVCRTAEHVLRLWQMLPSYHCVFRPPDAAREEALSRWGLLPPGWKKHPGLLLNAERARRSFETVEIKKAICTPVWREGVDFKHLRWLVRADGTANDIAAIQIGGRLARRVPGKEFAGLIDFWDGFSGFERRSSARFRRYAEEGWHVERIRA